MKKFRNFVYGVRILKVTLSGLTIISVFITSLPIELFLFKGLLTDLSRSVHVGILYFVGSYNGKMKASF